MRIKYKEPWTLNPDPVSYKMNTGSILNFNSSSTFFFYIDFSLPYTEQCSGKVDTYSNIVWKGNDELGIQLVNSRLVFTLRSENNKSEVLNFEYDIDEKTDFTVLITGNNVNTFIFINNIKQFVIPSKVHFSNTSTFNFGGGHSDNIEYDINFLSLGTQFLEDGNIDVVDETLPNVLGYYKFKKNTNEKSWDDSLHFNLLNRFYLT